MTEIHFYTACTMTKSVVPASRLTAQKLGARTVRRRFKVWRERIDSWKGDRFSAQQLYCGGNWSVVRRVVLAERSSINLNNCYVISAGYGLIKINSALAPYAATFGLGHEDSVVKTRGEEGPVENAEWWQALCEWRPAGIAGPRSFQEAFKLRPDDVHLLALSPSYLDAIADDLARGLSALSDPKRLIIISAAKKRHGILNENVINASSRLQAYLGGALGSLHVRLASEILNSIRPKQLNRVSALKLVGALLAKSNQREIPKRKQLSDAAVVLNIVRLLRNSTSPSYTGLLRELRKSGHACEMKRFKRLYLKVTNPL